MTHWTEVIEHHFLAATRPLENRTMRGAAEERREAFEVEMLPHLPGAYRLARALTGRDQDAEDLVQETFLRAFAGFGGYQRNTNARAWLFTVLRRIYFNERRRARVRPLLFSLGGPDDIDEPADTQALGPEDQTMRNFESRLVLDALAQLRDPYREALALVDLEGMRYAEAAAILNCPIGTVMSRLHRGRLELARRLHDARLQGAAG
jgi:RNA polymerase sigma-70 factor (ECF subfamily)